MQKKFHFQNSKQKYYKNIKNLIDKLNSDIDSINKFDDTESADSKEEIFSNFSEKTKLNEKNLEQVPCKICNKNQFKYTCPKCKINYCSVDCYKSHNIECTEDFYKRNVTEELKATKEDEKDTLKFRQKLKEMYERTETNQTKDIKNDLHRKEDFLSEERKNHLKKILKKLEEGVFDFSSDLTPTDWKEFEKFMNGFIENQKNNFLLWKPFWTCKLDNGFVPSLEVYDENFRKEYDEEVLKKIKDMEINEYVQFYKKNENKFEENNVPNENDDEQSSLDEGNNLDLEDVLDLDDDDFNQMLKEKFQYIEYTSGKIQIDRNLIYESLLLKFAEIPTMQNLSKLQPSDSNIFTLVYILCFIIFIFKLYNGEVNDNIDEIIEFILHNCKILYSKEKNFAQLDLNLTLNEFFSVFVKTEAKYFSSIRNMVLTDMSLVLKNKFYIFEALIRLYEMLHKYSKENRIVKDNKNLGLILNQSKHKIIYFLSYVKCLSKEKLEEVDENLSSIKRN
jgi:hypothetical protein